MACELCTSAGGDVIFEDGLARVVLVPSREFPGFCRVITHAHVKEVSDLPKPHYLRVMDLVHGTESALRTLLKPHKVNLASLGNMTPHVHWHVIPRYEDDSHFPDAIWAPPRRAAPARSLPTGFADDLRQALRTPLGPDGGR